MALMQSGLKGTNLFEYCDNNVVNKEDSNGFYSVKISSFAFAMLQLLGFNSIGLVLVYVGYVKFKRFLLKQYAKIIAKLSLKIPTWLGKVIAVVMGVLGIPSVLDFINALWDAFNLGYKYLSISLAKSRFGYYYKIDFRATKRRC